MKITIFCDGGARGNPGPAAIGVTVEIRDLKHAFRHAIRNKKEISKYIGEATNNQAEYRAVIEALEWVRSNLSNPIYEMGGNGQDFEIECLLDSELVVEQLNQRYKLRNEGLKPLFWQIRDLIMRLGGKVIFRYIPREQNKRADRLVNKALDEEIKSNKNTTTV